MVGGRARRRLWQYHVLAWFASDYTIRAVFPSVVAVPEVLGIMAGMDQKDSILWVCCARRRHWQWHVPCVVLRVICILRRVPFGCRQARRQVHRLVLLVAMHPLPRPFDCRQAYARRHGRFGPEGLVVLVTFPRTLGDGSNDRVCRADHCGRRDALEGLLLLSKNEREVWRTRSPRLETSNPGLRRPDPHQDSASQPIPTSKDEVQDAGASREAVGSVPNVVT